MSPHNRQHLRAPPTPAQPSGGSAGACAGLRGEPAVLARLGVLHPAPLKVQGAPKVVALGHVVPELARGAHAAEAIQVQVREEQLQQVRGCAHCFDCRLAQRLRRSCRRFRRGRTTSRPLCRSVRGQREAPRATWAAPELTPGSSVLAQVAAAHTGAGELHPYALTACALLRLPRHVKPASAAFAGASKLATATLCAPASAVSGLPLLVGVPLKERCASQGLCASMKRKPSWYVYQQLQSKDNEARPAPKENAELSRSLTSILTTEVPQLNAPIL